MNDDALYVAPHPKSWWERLLCRIGIHHEDIVLVPVTILDGVVPMPSHFVCTRCGRTRIHNKHKIENYQVCCCDTCREMLEMIDSRLVPYQDLYTWGPAYGKPKLVAIHRKTIEAHHLHKRAQHNKAHEKIG